MPLGFKFVYSDRYDLNLGEHIFPTAKYRMIRDRLLADGTAHAADFVEPVPASDEDMLRVHTAAWVDALRTGRLSFSQAAELEIPYSQEMVSAVWLATGGSIEAGRRALADTIGFNIGGGFHHAFADHGEGFCAINDVAVAIRTLQASSGVGRAMIVDCDAHHGNGSAAIFRDDPDVFTVSMHQFHNYPEEKPASDLDIHLADGCGDDEYLEILAARFPPSLYDFQPDLLFYVAGADPFGEDQLGGLALTIAGLKRRDSLVLKTARRHGIPVAIVLAGGYARRVEDTVTIHANTAAAAAEVISAA